MKNQKKLIIVAAALIFILIVVVIALKNSSTSGGNEEENKTPPEGDPVDNTLEFYRSWLTAAQSTNTNPYEAGLVDSDFITTKLRDNLLAAQTEYDTTGYDAVMCRTEMPEEIRSRVISEKEFEAQVLIVGPRGSKESIAIAKVVGENGVWKIDKIDCNVSEEAPKMGEYSFEQSGFLLKYSVQPPMDPNYWHLVYEVDGVMGYTAILYFDDSSSCFLPDGSNTSCGDESFHEAMPVKVQGNISEAGINVVNVNISEL